MSAFLHLDAISTSLQPQEAVTVGHGVRKGASETAVEVSGLCMTQHELYHLMAL